MKGYFSEKKKLCTEVYFLFVYEANNKVFLKKSFCNYNDLIIQENTSNYY